VQVGGGGLQQLGELVAAAAAVLGAGGEGRRQRRLVRRHRGRQHLGRHLLCQHFALPRRLRQLGVPLREALRNLGHRRRAQPGHGVLVRAVRAALGALAATGRGRGRLAAALLAALALLPLLGPHVPVAVVVAAAVLLLRCCATLDSLATALAALATAGSTGV